MSKAVVSATASTHIQSEEWKLFVHDELPAVKSKGQKYEGWEVDEDLELGSESTVNVGAASVFDFPLESFKGLSSSEKVKRLDLNALKSETLYLPRYLFRAYGPDSGGALTDKKYKDLNTENAITPHAFIKIDGVNKGHESASKIPDPKRMINGHIYTETSIQSEFSSWSPSLLLVLCYAEQKFVRHQSAHVCVIDTYNMRNGVYHVPVLIQMGLARRRRRDISTWKPYPQEYLVHGIVSGKGYTALSYDKIRNNLLKVYPEIRNNEDWGGNLRATRFAPSFAPVEITSAHVELLKGIAESFGLRELVFPLTISLVCLVKRFNLDYTAEELYSSAGFKPYVQSLKSITTHMDVDENWLVNDYQWIGDMTEVKHTKKMMLALVWSKFGRGKRLDVEVLAAQFESTHIHGGK